MNNPKYTDVQQLQLALKELESRIQNIVTSFPLGLIIVNKDQGIEAINHRAREIFQYASDEISEKPVAFLFPDLGEIEATDKPLRIQARRKSTENFMAEIQVTELEMYGQERFFINVQDIDERYKLERLRQELVELVSHDLRGPLMAIQFTLEMLDDGTYGDQTANGKVAISKAMTSTIYLMSMVKNLLDSEKIERGEIEINREKTSVGKIIEQAVTTAEAAKQEDSITIQSDYTNDQCIVDSDRIVQVLLNLISNAIKYSPEQSVVTVTAGIVGVDVVFEVSDQGPGISDNQKHLVFERYKRLEQDEKIKRKGFGLGLSICKALVEKHGGHIWVEDNTGSGSKFCFSIPIEN